MNQKKLVCSLFLLLEEVSLRSWRLGAMIGLVLVPQELGLAENLRRLRKPLSIVIQRVMRNVAGCSVRFFSHDNLLR